MLDCGKFDNHYSCNDLGRFYIYLKTIATNRLCLGSTTCDELTPCFNIVFFIHFPAPKAFTIKKSDKAVTEAADPFSKDRDYNINTGKPLDIKKSDKRATEFMEVHIEDKPRRVRTSL